MPRRYGHAPKAIILPAVEQQTPIPLAPVVPPGFSADDLSAAEQKAYDAGYAVGYAAGGTAATSAYDYDVSWIWFDNSSEWELTITVESSDTAGGVGGVTVELTDLADIQTTDVNGEALFYVDYGDAGPQNVTAGGFTDYEDIIDGPP